MDITKAYPSPVNIESLMATIRAAYPEASQGENGFRVHNISPENEATVSADLDSIIAAHNPSVQTTLQLETTQANSARAQLQALITGLSGLSATDKGYAVYCRLFAWRNGANQATLDGITNKATAQAYITGLAEWQAMTAASRAFFAKELEANAALCQVLLLVLTG